MKLTILLMLTTLYTSAQVSSDIQHATENAVGLTISSQTVGSTNIINDAPTFGISYRHSLGVQYELRISLRHQKLDFGSDNNSCSVAVGLGRFLFRHSRLSVYGAGEVSYNTFAMISFRSPTDPNSLYSFRASDIEINTLLGVDFKVSQHFSLFLESNLASIAVLDTSGNVQKFKNTKFKLLKGTLIGIKYRF